MNLIGKLLRVRRGETRSVFAFFLGFFFLVSALVVGKTARDTLFLSRFDPAYLPHMYVAVALAIAAAVALYNRLTTGVSQFTAAITTFAVGAVSLLIIQSLLSRWVYPVLYVWMDIIGTLCVIQFWFLTGRAFTPRQARRLFGIIGSGGAVAGTASGFAIRPFVHNFGTAPLLTLASLLLMLSLTVIVFLRPFLSRHHPEEKRPPARRTRSRSGRFKRPYLTAIAVTVTLSALVSSLVDYQLKIIASRTLDEASLAGLFGLLYGIIGVASVIMQFLVTGRILSHLGITWGLTFLPAALVAGNLMILALPVVMTAVMARAGDQIFRFTVHDAATQLLWVPVPMSEKKRTKPLIDGTIKNAAQGLSGLLILAVTAWVDVRYLSIPSLLFLGAWILSNSRLKKGYVHQLEKAIRKRQLDVESLQVDHTDPLVVNALRETLKTGQDAQILFALDTMKHLPLSPWIPDLKRVFRTASPQVKTAILRLTREEGHIISDEEILTTISDTDDTVASEAMLICGERKIARAQKPLEEILASAPRHRPVRQSGAAAGLILLSDHRHKTALRVLNGMLTRGDPRDQVAVLQLSISWRKESLLDDKYLVRLLNSPSPDVRKEAIRVASRRPGETLILPLADNLENPSTRPAARKALRNFDSTAVSEALVRRLLDPDLPGRLAKGLIHALEDHPVPPSRDALVEKVGPSGDAIARETVDVLGKMVRTTPLSPTQAGKVETVLNEEIRRLYRHLSLLERLPDGQEVFLVRDLLNHFIRRGKIHAIKLSLLPYPDAPVTSLTAPVRSSEGRSLSNVLEILDTILPRETRRKLLPIFDATSLGEKVREGHRIYPDTPVSVETALVDWAKSTDVWTSAVALHSILTPRFDPLLSRTADGSALDWERLSRSPLQRETVSKLWDVYGSRLQSLPGFVKQSWLLEDMPMYTTLEKTIFMKGVDLFRDIPGEDVYHMAQIAEEVVYAEGRNIFNEGDAGDSMYIIMNGAVQIHKNEKEIAVLKEGEFVGEMALLDQQPRSATATAADDSVLLQIRGEDFYDLMASRMEIMQGIVRVLTERLRQAIDGT